MNTQDADRCRDNGPVLEKVGRQRLRELDAAKLRQVIRFADPPQQISLTTSAKNIQSMPHTIPVYSNMAYAILGFVIEAVTHQPYAHYIQQAILDPINATHTSVHKPSDDSIGFISNETNWWFTDYGLRTRKLVPSSPHQSINPSNQLPLSAQEDCTPVPMIY